MIPAQYLSPDAAQDILDTLDEGQGTAQGSNNTYINNPSLREGLITANLAVKLRTSNLASSTSTIDTAGLNTAELDALNGMRSRIREGVATVYADIPKHNPLNSPVTGSAIGSAEQDHAVDVLIQTIYKWDSRYFLRLRSDVGAEAQNDNYELPSRYNYLTNPLIIATMRLHGFTSNAANIGPSFSRVSSSTPHGYYSGMTIQDTATSSATTWTANITQNNTLDFASVDTYFTTNAAPTFSTGNDVNVNVPSTANSAFYWEALNSLGEAEIQVTGNQLRFYRDVARTDLIRASWGNIVSTGWQGTDLPGERVAVNTDGQHLIIPTAPLQFEPLTGSNLSPSIFEFKWITDYNPVTQTFNSNVAGFSIYNGQLTNMISVTGSSGEFGNPVEDSTPAYFRGVDSDSFQLYRTEDLAAGNVWAFGNTTTISNIAYDAGNTVWTVNYSTAVDYPPLLGGQDIRFANTTGATAFSNAVSLTQNNTGNIQIFATAENFVHSAVGTVNDRQVMVAASNDTIVYSYNGKRWFTATYPVTSSISKIVWAGSVGRFFAMNNADTSTARILTSTDGITWTVAHAPGTSFRTLDFVDNTNDSVFGRLILLPASTSDDFIQYFYRKSDGVFVSAGTYSFDSIGVGRTITAAGDGYIAMVNGLAVYGSGSNDYINIATAFAGTPTAIAATTNLIVIKTATTLWRESKSAGGLNNANVAVTGTILKRVNATQVHGITATGDAFIVNDGGFRNRGTYTTGNFTVNSVNTPVFSLGLIRGKYIFANAQNTGVTEGYSRVDVGIGALDPAYDDIFTATAHPFTTGQQVRPSATFNFNGTLRTPPRNLWIEVIDVNSFELYEDEARTVGYGSDRPSGVMTASTVTPVFYVKRRSARTWELYLGSDITSTANRFSDNTKMTGGTTTGSTVWNGYKTSVAADADVGLRPLFYTQYHSNTRVSLWRNAAKTLPYAYFGRNGTLLNQQTSYATIGRYRLTNIAHELVLGSDNVLPSVIIGINSTPLYFAKVLNDFVVELYTDQALTTPYTQVTWANSAATLWQVNPNTFAPWRLDNFYVPNIGSKTYFTTNLTTNTTTVNASWVLTGSKYYTSYDETQYLAVAPTLINVNEHLFSNAGAYFGHMRFTDTTGTGGPGNVGVVSGTTFGGFGNGPTPVFYSNNDPGRFISRADIAIGIDAAPDTGTAPAIDEALAYTGNAWATSSNLTDRELRVWPSTIAPQSMTWTIEQPNSTLESYNLTRYSRARDVTQYRMRLVYPPMTKVQVAEFTNVIHAAKGSFKPLVFTPPVNNVTQQYVTIKVGDKNITVPPVFRARVDNASGQQIIQVDGLPPSLTLSDPAFDAGWAIELPIRNSTGSWGIPIHDVLTNAYGEANMRLNNSIASAIDFGAAIGADAADLDVFIDADSVELKVDTHGFHYLEIDLVTKRIF